jgi:HlyD family secretion protein
MFPSLLVMLVGVGVAWLVTGCTPAEETRWQGYLEGEYVYVSSPLGGRLEQLAVARGDWVEEGASLFILDQTVEHAGREAARRRLASAEARLADLQKGQRPSELAALEARLDQARAGLDFSQREAKRMAGLYAEEVVSAEVHDRARFAYQRDAALVVELEAQLATARLGAREDAVTAAEAEVAAAQAEVDRAVWGVTEKAPIAPAAAWVYDTLFREGEVVSAGQPVVALLPPANLKVRFFVPEAVRATLLVGDTVQVNLSGRDAPVPARIVYFSPQAEFTPPVLYNRENRAKLVFMIEAVFAEDAGVELLPGQPVDVTR